MHEIAKDELGKAKGAIDSSSNGGVPKEVMPVFLVAVRLLHHHSPLRERLSDFSLKFAG
jgi:hypothetical protein